jgi:hypothetical protein
MQRHLARTATHLRLLVPSCRGGAVTGEVDRVMHVFGKIPSIKNNKLMGFHFNVYVEGVTLGNLNKVRQNFIT